MRFPIDYDVLDDAAYSIEAFGYQVVRLRDVFLSATADEEFFKYTNDNDFIHVTCNCDDFLSLRFAKRPKGRSGNDSRHLFEPCLIDWFRASQNRANFGEEIGVSGELGQGFCQHFHRFDRTE